VTNEGLIVRALIAGVLLVIACAVLAWLGLVSIP